VVVVVPVGPALAGRASFAAAHNLAVNAARG
jgi:hypothetical protein